MFKKTAVSILLSAVMLISCLVIPATTVAAVTDSTEAVAADNATAYNLASDVQNGNILHAFNWRFTDVSRYMREIAQAGFTSVQVSPVQGSKPTINVATYACDWMYYYQPINFEVGNGLGTKEDFKQMCETADEYGIKIIVDIVSNHMAQADSGVSGALHPDIISDLRDDETAWHTGTSSTSDSSRQSMTQRLLGGLPDLNTGSEKVQNYVKALLKECIDYGADGFRFDAAKHIELPSDDASFASDFWPNVTSYARSLKPDIYIYGEALAPLGTDTENYLQYMNLTDSGYGNKIRSVIRGTSATSTLGSYNLSGADADQLVVWIESHDNFADGTSRSLTDEHLLLGWGIIGAREGAAALYLCRPAHNTKGVAYDELIGGPGYRLWENETVVQINQFRNAFEGQSETVASSGSQFYVQRGTSGMVIVNLAQEDAAINYTTTMQDGTYTDQVSGNTFTVTDGQLAGTVAARSVAVIYNKDKLTPIAHVQLNGEAVDGGSVMHFAADTAQIDVALEDAQSFTYSVNGAAPVEVTGDGSFTIGSGIAYNTEIPVTITASNADYTTSATYNIVKKDPNAKVVAYFNISGNESWIDDSGIYCYAKDENGNELVEYPGYEMVQVRGTDYYKVEIPGVTKAIIKFNEGPVSTGLDGRTIPPTVVNYGSAEVAENREAGGFEIIGAMMWEDGVWQDCVNEPQSGDRTECTPYALGDVDGDGKLQVKDVLAIQKHVAKVEQLTEEGQRAADINGDKTIDIEDVLPLQRYIAAMQVDYPIGEPVEEEVGEYTIYFNNYKDWEQVYAYYWQNQGGTSVAWPGVELTEKVSDTVYKLTLPADQNAIIFNNGSNGGQQSNDIIVTPENYDKMVTCAFNEDGSYGIWTEPDVFPEIPDLRETIYFENTTNWAEVACYAYRSGSGQNNGAWPGEVMTLVGTNAAGNEVYSVKIEKDTYDRLIFNNNNNGRQSADIEEVVYGGIYTPVSTSGKFTCTVEEYTGLE